MSRHKYKALSLGGKTNYEKDINQRLCIGWHYKGLSHMDGQCLYTFSNQMANFMLMPPIPHTSHSHNSSQDIL